MKIRIWESRIGAEVRSGRLHLELWEHGGVTRCVADDSLVGYRGTHFSKVPVGPIEEMAAAALQSWKTDSGNWEPCH